MPHPDGKPVYRSNPHLSAIVDDQYVWYKGGVLASHIYRHYVTKLEHMQALPGDVVLNTMFKCGTTWMKSVIFSVLNYDKDKNALDSSKFVHDEMPCLDWVAYDNGIYNPLEMLEKTEYRPRIYQFHSGIDLMPESVKKNAKVGWLLYNIKSQ